MDSGGVMRGIISSLLVPLAILSFPVASQAKVQINIDLSTQTMDVESSSGSYSWPISSARAGYVTPDGTFSVQRMERIHYSKKYDNSPMPHSIFFHGGFAIHGSYETRWIGHPASHGCVRLYPANAATLYSLVKEEGGATIHIVGSPPVTNYRRTRYSERAPRYRRNRWRHESGERIFGIFPIF
jgi:hypothetical protein